jgi:hypothetical protein
MARERPSLDRIQNPRDELQRAIQRAEKGLSGAAGEGFREVLTRVRQAVLDSGAWSPFSTVWSVRGFGAVAPTTSSSLLRFRVRSGRCGRPWGPSRVLRPGSSRATTISIITVPGP